MKKSQYLLLVLCLTLGSAYAAEDNSMEKIEAQLIPKAQQTGADIQVRKLKNVFKSVDPATGQPYGECSGLNKPYPPTPTTRTMPITLSAATAQVQRCLTAVYNTKESLQACLVTAKAYGEGKWFAMIEISVARNISQGAPVCKQIYQDLQYTLDQLPRKNNILGWPAGVVEASSPVFRLEEDPLADAQIAPRAITVANVSSKLSSVIPGNTSATSLYTPVDVMLYCVQSCESCYSMAQDWAGRVGHKVTWNCTTSKQCIWGPACYIGT